MFNQTNTATGAIGRWPGILQSFGVDPKHLKNKHGPCPVCNGIDRFRFDDKGGKGTWFCSHCGSGDGFTLLSNLFGWPFKKAAHEVEQVIGAIPVGPVAKEETDESKLKRIRKVWCESLDVMNGDPVWLYLNRRIGIDDAPRDLKFHPALPYFEDGKVLAKFPAMIACMRDPEGRGVAIHRTYLTEDGDKASVSQPKKIMAGKPLNRSAVRLSPICKEIGIAEGVETALASFKRFGIPTWAATTAVLLQDWVPPVGIKRILIAGDNDETYTGQQAAYSLARRLRREGYDVVVRIPEQVGKDWAD